MASWREAKHSMFCGVIDRYVDLHAMLLRTSGAM